MPIHFPNGSERFITWPDAPHTPALGIESKRVQECLSEIERRGLKGAFGAHPYFRETTLDFLAELGDLEAAQFWDVQLTSISALYELTRLRYLRLTEKRPALDLNRLRSLRCLVWTHHPKDNGSGALEQLEELHLWRYKPPVRSFAELPLPASLTTLCIYWSNARTLDGLPSLPKLTRLQVERCRDLESLGRLAASCPGLESLTVSACGRLRAADAMRVAADLPRLSHLFADNQLLIDRGPSIM